MRRSPLPACPPIPTLAPPDAAASARIRPSRSIPAALAALAVLGTTLSAQPAAAAEAAATPVNGTIAITGAGWGHGKGMSQYGAWGAADAGLAHEKILAFYYPGTTIAKLKSGSAIRVWITADTDNTLDVLPESGLRVRDSTGRSYTLPTGSTYRQWRIARSGSKRVLQYLNAKDSWVTRKVSLAPTGRVWTFDNPKRSIVKVRLPNGKTRDYREKLALRFYGSEARTVNTVGMENYLRGVVPREMPTSWHREAVQAQAVAARSYAARAQLAPRTSIYDICDTAACQVYGGQDDETSGGDAAVTATKNQVLKAGSGIALTMFSSSNGGHSADGGTSYLVAKPDPYDGRMRNPKWTTLVSAATVQKKYPSIGTLRSIRVTERDGDGPWGGRADKVVITGSEGSVSVTGGSFKTAFGLKERLFGVFGGLKPGTGNYERWQDLGGTTGVLGGPSAGETAVAGGLYAQFEDGELYWSQATGSRLLTGTVADAYRKAGGPSGKLGFPTADASSGSAEFQKGTISCSRSGNCQVNYS
ncbi:MAG: SpoIID/LytB domain-containing protein [Micropruina sp.]|uniref:SpoIID/LytB domain-containing protein n=1 Tax=Micropruina sp. TaxID=2737536 RepID=UPI0039E39689